MSESLVKTSKSCSGMPQTNQSLGLACLAGAAMNLGRPSERTRKRAVGSKKVTRERSRRQTCSPRGLSADQKRLRDLSARERSHRSDSASVRVCLCAYCTRLSSAHVAEPPQQRSVATWEELDGRQHAPENLLRTKLAIRLQRTTLQLQYWFRPADAEAKHSRSSLNAELDLWRSRIGRCTESSSVIMSRRACSWPRCERPGIEKLSLPFGMRLEHYGELRCPQERRKRHAAELAELPGRPAAAICSPDGRVSVAFVRPAGSAPGWIGRLVRPSWRQGEVRSAGASSSFRRRKNFRPWERRSRACPRSTFSRIWLRRTCERKGLCRSSHRSPRQSAAYDAAVGRSVPAGRLVKRSRLGRHRIDASQSLLASPTAVRLQPERWFRRPTRQQLGKHVYAPPPSIIPKEYGRVEREARLFRHRHPAASRCQSGLCFCCHADEQYGSTAETTYLLVAELARVQRRLWLAHEATATVVVVGRPGAAPTANAPACPC